MQSRLPAVALLLALLLAAPCAAQDRGTASTNTAPDTSTAASPSTASAPKTLQARSPNTVSVWAGGSFASGGPIGNIPQSHIGMIGLQYQRRLVPPPPEPRHGLTLAYTVDVFPLLFLSIPPSTASFPPEAGDLGGPSESPLRKRGLDAYGFGASPAGLRVTAHVAPRVQPFLSGSTGLLYFTESIPNKWGQNLNFIFDMGAGVQIVLSPDLLLTVGYHYHHLSNGFRGRINPGIDAHLLHLGVALSR